MAKKKAVKKKAVKKKAVKKRVKLIPIDDVYRLINRVQINKKEVKFSVSCADSVTTKNIVEDLDLDYKQKDLKSRTDFSIYPNSEDDIGNAQEITVDFLEDEIPERGQLF